MNSRKMVPLRASERGMSLAELLVATSIFTVVILAALFIYDRSNRVFKQGVEAAEAQQNTRVAFDRITADLRMAGFDFDRDGIPTVTGAFQSPDEQFEYIGRNAITIRGNFDYQSNPDNGRECVPDTTDPRRCQPNTGLESAQFPIVTTGNDEIVTYGLVSENASANDDEIVFYADVPDRKAHTASGGRAEQAVEIEDVDLSNNNPPYTLYRFTLAPGNSISVVRTPLAENIRSLTFDYYEDATGVTPLRDLNGNALDPATIGTTVGGEGAIDPAAGNVEIARQIRQKVQSVRMTLIGMNEAPDPGYTAPNESIVAVQNRRQYRVETLVAPRNYQRRGMREQDLVPPDPPTVSASCTGYCGAIYLKWTSPTTGGGAESYNVLYDVDDTGGFSGIVQVGNQLTAAIPLPDPSVSYYFAVQAVNSYGAATSSTIGPFSVKNATVPSPPTLVAVTANSDAPQVASTPVTVNTPEPNRITLEWAAPGAPASGAASCSMGSGQPAQLREELAGWRIERSSDSGSTWTSLGTITTPADPITGLVRWADTSVANCVNYYYRIRTIERCIAADNQNTSGDKNSARSVFSEILVGRAVAAVAPAAPTTLQIVQTAPTSCNGTTCNIALDWSPVTADASGNPITVSEYKLMRKRFPAGSTVADATETIAPINAGNASFGSTIRYIDSSVLQNDGAGNPYSYEYTIFARQCDLESASGPTRRYPCIFGGGAMTLGVGMSPAPVEGSGSSSDPWLASTPASVTVTSSGGSMQSVEFRFTNQGSGASLGEGVRTGPTSATSFDIPSSVTDGMLVRVDITVFDASGCTRSITRYFTDSPSNCCLTPQDFEPSIVAIDGPGRRVRIQLKNICDLPLTLRNPSLSIVWDPTRLNSNPRRLETVVWPVATGAPPTAAQTLSTTATSVTSNAYAVAGAVTTIPVDTSAATDDYFVDVTFSRSFTLNPITSLCVHYQRSTDLAVQNCKIVPQSSTTANVCP